MILYTMMPQELIFPTDEEAFSQQISVPIEGGRVIVERLESGRYKVVQLICGDASIYLNPKYQPGTLIDANQLI